MKNLYMIMCHKNIEQVYLLARRLATTKSDVVIHIDSYLKEDTSKLHELVANHNVFITEKRIHGYLDDRSLVDIVFIMISYMKKLGKVYKYYALLSGQDYLIKPINTINEYLFESYPKPFIDCTPYDKTNWVANKFDYKYSQKYSNFNKFINKRLKKSIFRTGIKCSAYILKKFFSIFSKTCFQNLNKIDVFPYGGSAWWILPDIIINYAFELYTTNSDISSILLKTLTPEEVYFQTIVMTSLLKDNVEINPVYMREQNCKTYAYFSDEGKPFCGHPYIFTVDKFEFLKKSDCFFARKFDITIDREIIDLIDNYVD